MSAPAEYRAGKRVWSAEDDALLRRRYADEPTQVLATELGRSLRATYARAAGLGLAKSQVYLDSPAACRLRRDATPASIATRFKPGQVPPNKGLRRPGWGPGRMRETQFKPGERTGVAARNWCPVGTIRSDADGYLRIKVREATPGEAYGFGNVRVWPLLSRHLWAEAHGPIPPGHSVRFKDGNKQHCVIDNLELVSQAEMMRRNTIHNLPAPLPQTLQLLGALNRKIRRMSRVEEKQD